MNPYRLIFAMLVVSLTACSSACTAPTESDGRFHLVPPDRTQHSVRAIKVMAGSKVVPVDRIVGRYDIRGLFDYQSLDVNDNGTFVYQFSGDLGHYQPIAGQWSVRDGMLALHSDSGSLPSEIGPTMILVELDGRLALMNPDNPLNQQCDECEGVVLEKANERLFDGRKR